MVCGAGSPCVVARGITLAETGLVAQLVVPKTVLVEPAQGDMFEADVQCFAPQGVFVRCSAQLGFRTRARLTFAPSGSEPLQVEAEVISASAAGTAFELLSPDQVAREVLKQWSKGATVSLNTADLPRPGAKSGGLPPPVDLVRDLL